MKLKSRLMHTVLTRAISNNYRPTLLVCIRIIISIGLQRCDSGRYAQYITCVTSYNHQYRPTAMRLGSLCTVYHLCDVELSLLFFIDIVQATAFRVGSCDLKVTYNTLGRFDSHRLINTQHRLINTQHRLIQKIVFRVKARTVSARLMGAT